MFFKKRDIGLTTNKNYMLPRQSLVCFTQWDRPHNRSIPGLQADQHLPIPHLSTNPLMKVKNILNSDNLVLWINKPFSPAQNTFVVLMLSQFSFDLQSLSDIKGIVACCKMLEKYVKKQLLTNCRNPLRGLRLLRVQMTMLCCKYLALCNNEHLTNSNLPKYFTIFAKC